MRRAVALVPRCDLLALLVLGLALPSYSIKGVTQTNLHSYWDSGANTWATGLKRPLDVQGEAWLANLTGYITQVTLAS